MLSARLAVRRVGTRYLRLDQKVDGFAGSRRPSCGSSSPTRWWASPVTGRTRPQSGGALRPHQGRQQGQARPGEDRRHRYRRPVGRGERGEERFCVILAGDIVYQMAHDVPRPERSTGKMVRGSDLDVVVVVEDQAPEALVTALDDAIYQQKYRYLINPSVGRRSTTSSSGSNVFGSRRSSTLSRRWWPARSSRKACSSTAARPCSMPPRPSLASTT